MIKRIKGPKAEYIEQFHVVAILCIFIVKPYTIILIIATHARTHRCVHIHINILFLIKAICDDKSICFFITHYWKCIEILIGAMLHFAPPRESISLIISPFYDPAMNAFCTVAIKNEIKIYNYSNLSQHTASINLLHFC